MSTTPVVLKDPTVAATSGEHSEPHSRLQHAIEHASHLLPSQGPITVFIHHNTLHAFESLPFEQAVERGAEIFGCHPYLTEERFREALAKGRIRVSDLRAVLQEDLGSRADEPILGFGTRLDLRMSMLQFPLGDGPAAVLRWFVAETDALRTFRSDVSAATRAKIIAECRRWVMRDLRGGNGRPAWVTELFKEFGASGIEMWPEKTWEAFTLETLWRVCQQGVHGVPHSATPPATPVRHRDLLLAVGESDSDPLVQEVLIRFCAAFLDQGVSHWPMPDREAGFFRAFCSLYRHGNGPPDRWMSGLAVELARLADANVEPLESARESLTALGVPESEWDDYLSATLLALRGWGGIIQQVEERGDRVAHQIPKGTLIGFVAIRLLLERFALAHQAREALGYAGPLSELRDELRRRLPKWTPPAVEERAFPVFQLAQVLGWAPDELSRLTPGEWALLLREIEGFSNVPRRRVFHLAFERRFHTQTLDALALHARRKPRDPRFQLVTCLDEREESFRRHAEEVAPDCETYGAAGFFGVPMYYRGAADAHYVPLCPIVITPGHWVEEQVDVSLEEAHRRLRKTQKAVGTVAHTAHGASRSLALGALITGGLGVLASIPLVARILFPRLTSKVRKHLGRFVRTPKETQLKLDRQQEPPGEGNGHVGFLLAEKVAMGERFLRDIGLISGFARLVMVIGHGSNSMNNPHKSAYDCGACGGSPGAPNGRAAAQILNDEAVRGELRQRGIDIPNTTWFVGGFHNTCDDSVTLADLGRIPDSHKKELEHVMRDMEETCDRNAHERCRRFMSAPLTLTPREARQHVEGRSEDLAQTRPELGHATNAICLVSRRERSRGLYFDRRAFLTSYDPTQDTPDAAVLTRTMSAVFPVCGGINLEYYFSHVDSPGYGCGTKLPHNVSALLGVMDGAASDLRTGLPWQMTEIHEPVRLLIVCEAPAEVVMTMLKKNPMMMQMTANEWVILAVQDPDTQAIQVFKTGSFRPYTPLADHLPQAGTSIDWYRGWRDHLEFAELTGRGGDRA